jgi:hypothetical protein
MTDEPSGWKIQRALEAWHEATADDDWHSDDLGDNPAADVIAIIGQLLRAQVEAETMALGAKIRLDELNVRKTRFEQKAARLKRIAFQLMEAVGERRINLPDITASPRRGGQSVVITDESKLPAEYKITRTETAPDKRKIAADLAVGVVIDGAELRNGADTLVIRAR